MRPIGMVALCWLVLPVLLLPTTIAGASPGSRRSLGPDSFAPALSSDLGPQIPDGIASPDRDGTGSQVPGASIQPTTSSAAPPTPDNAAPPGRSDAPPPGRGDSPPLPMNGTTGRTPGNFGWPLRPWPPIVRRFDKPAHDWLPGHRGVDLGGVAGQQVLAAGDGVVVFAGEVAGKPVVSMDHPGGLRTTYEPVRASVPVGRRMIRGEVLGVLEPGHPGCAAACLHWGLRRGREYLDPLGLIRLAPLRLKPVRPDG